MIEQRAAVLCNDLGTFIGIVAFDPRRYTFKEAVAQAWGTITHVTRELDAFDLAQTTRKAGWPVFTYSCNSD